MKKKTFYLNSVSKNKLFRPVRERKDIITILLESIRLMINDTQIPQEKSFGEMIFHISKASRIIYFSDNKYFSINFPFFVDNSDRCLIYDKNGVIIDSRVISKLMELFIQKDIVLTNNFPEFFDVMEGSYDEKDVWVILWVLLTFEEGYIRFDNDIEHIGINHPQYHIDLFYEEHNKIKFGLNNNINNISFYKLLVNDDFYFLNKTSNPDQEPTYA